MPKVDLTVEEILVFNPDLPTDKIEVLIRDGLALARRAAPCIDEDSFMYPEAAAAIIRAAVLRWAESGGGAISSQMNVAGPFPAAELGYAPGSPIPVFPKRGHRAAASVPDEQTRSFLR